MNSLPDYPPTVDSPRTWRSLSLSLVTHLLLLLLLLWVVRPPGLADQQGERDRAVSVVLTRMDQQKKTEYLAEAEAEDVESPDSPNELASQSAAATASPPALETATEQPELPGIDPGDLNSDANQMTEVPDQVGLNTEFVLSKEDLEMIAREQKLLQSQQPVGDPVSISAFGSGKMNGRKFVFVLDRSHSMGEAGLGVLDRAREELTAAVEQLQPHHSFQVVAYHDRTSTIARRELLKANRANKSLLPQFISRLVAYGSTSHENGLYSALAFRPDAILFMTDGGSPKLNGGQLEAVRLMARNNRRGSGGTQIHCIQFGSGPQQESKNFMMEMARQNGGTYRYINVNQWNRD